MDMEEFEEVSEELAQNAFLAEQEVSAVEFKNTLIRLDSYKGYKLFIPKGCSKRIFIDGPSISCELYWYSEEKAHDYIDFTIKYLVKRILIG